MFPDQSAKPIVPDSQRLAAIVESSEDAIIGKDLNGIVESWNTGAERLYGYASQEMIGKSMELLLPAGRKDEEPAILKEIHAGRRFDHFETTRRNKNGETIYVSLTISPIRDVDGEIVGASHIARNITERVKQDRVASQLAAIVESSHDAIASKSLNGTVESWNRAAGKLYGYSAGEIIGKSIAILLPADRQDEETDILRRIADGEQVESYETVRVRKDGTLIRISLTVSPIRNSRGEIEGASHIARDITEQRTFEARMQQTQKMESLGVLAGGVAHDFNNLLTGILGNISLALERSPRVSPIRGQLEDAMKAAERAANLTRQLLAYAGKGSYVIEKIDLSELVKETCQLIGASIPGNVQVMLELDQGLPAIEGDIGQVQQVIMNLVINAAEAIGANTGTVIVRTWLQDADDLYIRTVLAGCELKPGQYVALDVHDTGCGMDAGTQALIFEPFFTTKFTGRGLGLAAVLGIIRSHGGALKVYSMPGEGSTFKVLLPVLAQDREAAAAEDKTADPLRGRGQIMVVDDDEVIGRFVVMALEHYGYSVTLERSGNDAISIFSRTPDAFRLILLDLTMPGMNGEEVFRQMRILRPGVPVLLTSGFSKTGAVRHFVGKGLTGFIQKPYSARQLAEHVKAALEPSSPVLAPE
jgi:two-component system cell cycle sensor histidine kinase/response regulator CckA